MKTVKKLVLSLLLVVTLPLLGVLLHIGVWLSPCVRRVYRSIYEKSLKDMREAVETDKGNNLLVFSRVEGINIYTLKYDAPAITQLGDAGMIFGIGVVLNQCVSSSPYYDAVLWHEIGHAKLHRFSPHNSSVFGMLKMELEADKFACDKGQAKGMLKHLVYVIKKDPIVAFPVLVWIHFPRMVHLVYRILIG